MNQEKVTKIIKEIRKKNGLTQKEFASLYNVTYQAVSKWETGKNIPDIILLKRICNDYNIDINDLLEGNKETKKPKSFKVIILIIILFLVLINIIIFFNIKRDNNFAFKTLTSNCSNFIITGSIAYNQKKSSIYISDINYCGGDDLKRYNEIECMLYEKTDSKEKKISENKYSGDKNIKLEDYLKNITFNVEHYSDKCKHYKDDSLYLIVRAIDKESKTTTYKIPLKLNSNC